MNEPFTELYKGYLLKCAPQATPDEKYLARTVISFAEVGGHKEITRTQPNGRRIPVVHLRNHFSFMAPREGPTTPLRKVSSG